MGAAQGVSLLGGCLRAVRRDGTPGGEITGRPALGSLYPRSARPVVLVHGFRYDPGAADDDNAHRSTFAHWRRDILEPTSGGRETLGFGWWSCPGGKFSYRRHAASVLSAWRHGRWNTYRHAWDLAGQAGEILARVIAGLERPVDLLAHSLGSRVVLAALRANPSLPVGRVVLMNAAELSATGFETARLRPSLAFVNLVVPEDAVLRYFGSLFSPGDLYAATLGCHGLRNPKVRGGSSAYLPNWCDLALDDPRIKAWAAAQGWPDIAGDDPREPWDHWHSHKHPGNWPLIRGLLDGAVALPGQAQEAATVWPRRV